MDQHNIILTFGFSGKRLQWQFPNSLRLRGRENAAGGGKRREGTKRGIEREGERERE